ncbi:DUF5325 family protein [Salsuginibacillus kocurii]|uniref:DUF5325 family protein n=1 Tax=Salsuginibacillus kocurii TaxID=427078 RepID=UPI000368EFF9|nr:DUF5325 family protein [Salsuginibacillus kocurii]
MMTKEKWIFLLLATLTVCCILALGVAVAERSIWIALGAVGVMFGCFNVARSYREKLQTNSTHN